MWPEVFISDIFDINYPSRAASYAGELAKHAVSEGTKAVTKFVSFRAPDDPDVDDDVDVSEEEEEEPDLVDLPDDWSINKCTAEITSVLHAVNRWMYDLQKNFSFGHINTQQLNDSEDIKACIAMECNCIIT